MLRKMGRRRRALVAWRLQASQVSSCDALVTDCPAQQGGVRVHVKPGQPCDGRIWRRTGRTTAEVLTESEGEEEEKQEEGRVCALLPGIGVPSRQSGPKT